MLDKSVNQENAINTLIEATKMLKTKVTYNSSLNQSTVSILKDTSKFSAFLSYGQCKIEALFYGECSKPIIFALLLAALCTLYQKQNFIANVFESSVNMARVLLIVYRSQ